MSCISINQRTLDNLNSARKPYFLRDNALKGFGVKVNPYGKVSFVAEVWHDGKSCRKTLGEYPFLQIQQAKTLALDFISSVKSGAIQNRARTKFNLEDLFSSYIAGGRLKQRTVIDYTEAVSFYLSDWCYVAVPQACNVVNSVSWKVCMPPPQIVPF